MSPTIKSSSALLLQIATVLIGLAILAFMLWEPHLEGRNAHATTFEIYFNDPFLAYIYLGSTPFFIAVYRAFGLFGHARRTGAFSQVTVDALRAIKHCGIALIGFVVVGAVIIIITGDGEDRPAGIFMSLLAITASTVLATTAAFFARNLRNSLERSGARPG